MLSTVTECLLWIWKKQPGGISICNPFQCKYIHFLPALSNIFYWRKTIQIIELLDCNTKHISVQFSSAWFFFHCSFPCVVFFFLLNYMLLFLLKTYAIMCSKIKGEDVIQKVPLSITLRIKTFLVAICISRWFPLCYKS